MRELKRFERDWLRTFANDVPRAKIREYVTKPGNYIWHVFSYGLISDDLFLSGNTARYEFDHQDLTNSLFYEPFTDSAEPKIIDNTINSEVIEKKQSAML